MIKIGIISTCEYVKSSFANKIGAEFIEQGQKPAIISDTSLQSAFSKFEDPESHALWTYCNQLAIELEISTVYDSCICMCPVIDPFLVANSMSVRTDMLTQTKNAANLWMDTYDTIVYLRDGYLCKEEIIDLEFRANLEREYRKWVNCMKGLLPISEIDSRDIYEGGRKWLI